MYVHPDKNKDDVERAQVAFEGFFFVETLNKTKLQSYKEKIID